MYYPLVQRRLRADIRAIEKSIDECGKAIDSREFEQLAMKAVIDRFISKGIEAHRLPAFLHAISAEAQGLLTWGQWYADGHTILEVSSGLTRALQLSDCGDLIFADLMPDLPPGKTETLYVRFCGDHGIVFSEGKVRFEGAYVLLHHAAIRIVLCGKMPPDTPIEDQWLERYDLRIPHALFGHPIREAVDEALAIDLQDIENRRSSLTQPEHHRAADLLADRLKTNHGAWREAVFLVANLLAWLRHMPDDIEDRWPADAPVRLVEQVQGGSPKMVARARSKLWSVGFIPIRRVGVRFEQAFKIGYHVKAHIRRGHWRNQPYGAGLSLRKLIWILPTLVGGKSS